MRPSAFLCGALLLLAAAAVSAATDMKLQAAAAVPAIMNGHDAYKRFDWFAYLRFPHPSNPDRWSNCGGQLIDPLHILTAAHCVFRREGVLNPLGTARIGILKLDEDASLHETIEMAQYIPHPSYNDSVIGEWDVAIIRLARPSTKTPVALARYTPKPDLPVPAGTILQAIGFGALQLLPEYEEPNTLQETSLQLRPLDACNTEGLSPNPFLTNTRLCTTPPGAIAPPYWSDVCDGDSGGPLFLPAAEAGKSDIVYGIVSHGPQCDKEEGSTTPGYWLDIAAVRCWIETAAGLPVSKACQPCRVPNCARCDRHHPSRCAQCSSAGYKLNRWGACVPKTCLDYDRWCHRCSPWKPLRCHSCKSRWYKVDARTGRCRKRHYL